MTRFSRFREYLDRKGKVQEKPIQATADNLGDQAPEPDKTPPEFATSGKNWKSTTPKEKPKPYVGVGTEPGQQSSDGKLKKTAEKGFAQEGDKNLIYEPKNSVPYGKEGGKQITGWPKGKTEAFLDDTSNMTLAEFASYVTAQNKKGLTDLPTVTGYKMGPFYPDPLEALRYVIALASTNDRLMESLVIMLKQKGKLDKFLREASNHSDTYNELAFLLADPAGGGSFARRLVKALSEVSIGEITAPPAQDDVEVVKPKKKSPMKPDPNGQPGAQQPPQQPQDQQDQGQNASTPATMQGQDMGQQAMAGVQQTQGGGPQQPEHNLIMALMAKRMLP